MRGRRALRSAQCTVHGAQCTVHRRSVARLCTVPCAPCTIIRGMRFILAALALLTAAAATAQPMLSQPALSPDGRSIAFVSGDDIWIAPAAGGDAHILIANPASESRPLFSPDGKSLAFV